MADILQNLGIKKEQKADFAQTLFYFIREFKFNPLDEVYLVGDKKIIKKGISIPLFNALLEEMNKHYKREEAEMKKARR